MKFKKALSAVLAGTMAFALMVAPAFADTTVTGTNINGSDGAAASFSVDYTASATAAPTICVVVPANSGTIQLNPYQLKVTVSGKDVYDQVISSRQVILNKSNVDIRVGYTVQGVVEKIGGTTDNTALTFATASVKDTETKKTVFLYIDTEVSEKGDAVAATVAADKLPDLLEFDDASKTKTIIGTKAVTKANAGEIPATEDTTAGAEATKFGYLVYGINGNATKNPTTAWTQDDKVSISLAFTFTALAGEAPTPAAGG